MVLNVQQKQLTPLTVVQTRSLLMENASATQDSTWSTVNVCPALLTQCGTEAIVCVIVMWILGVSEELLVFSTLRLTRAVVNQDMFWWTEYVLLQSDFDAA